MIGFFLLFRAFSVTCSLPPYYKIDYEAWLHPSGKFLSRCANYHLLIKNLSSDEWSQWGPPIAYEDCSNLIWSPLGDGVAIAGDSSVTIYSFPQMTRNIEIPSPPVWNPAASLLAYQTNSTLIVSSLQIALWSVQMPGPLLESLAWSPDGLMLAALTGTQAITIWWVSNGTVCQTLKTNNMTGHYVWASTTSLLMSDPDGLSTIDISTGARSLVSHVERETLSRSGSLIIAKDKVWDTLSLSGNASDLRLLGTLPAGAALSRDHSVALEGKKLWVGLIEAFNRTLQLVNDGSVSLVWQPNSTVLALAGVPNDGLVLLDVATGFTQKRVGKEDDALMCQPPVFSLEGNLFAVVCAPSTIRVFNSSTLIVLQEYKGTHAVWITDDSLITVHQPSATIILWGPGGKAVKQVFMPDLGVVMFAVSVGTDFFVISTNSTLQAFSAVNLTRAWMLQASLQGEIVALASSNTGLLAAASRSTVAMWNGLTGELLHLRSFSSTGSSRVSLSWAADGLTLALPCDQQLLVWRPGQYDQTILVNSSISSIAWRPRRPLQLAYSTSLGVTFWQPADVIKRADPNGLPVIHGSVGLFMEVEGDFLDPADDLGQLRLEGYPECYLLKVVRVEQGRTLRSVESRDIEWGGCRTHCVHPVYLTWFGGTRRTPLDPLFISTDICNPGYGPTQNDGCVQCPSKPLLPVFQGLAMFLIYIAAQSCLVLRKQRKRQGQVQGVSVNSQVLGLISSTIQLHMILGLNLKDIPGSFISTSSQGGVYSFTATHCLLSSAGVSSDAVHRVKFVLMLVTPVFVYVGCQLLWFGLFRRPSHNVSVVFAVYAWSNLHSLLITAQFKSLVCSPLKSQFSEFYFETTLYDSLEFCGQSSYALFVVFAVVPGFLYLLIPLFASFKQPPCSKWQKTNSLDFMAGKYKRRGWIFVQLLRSSILILITILGTAPFIIIWLAVHLVATILVNPYGSKLFIILESSSLLSGLAIAFADARNESSYAIAGVALAYTAMLGVLLAVNCPCYRCHSRCPRFDTSPNTNSKIDSDANDAQNAKLLDPLVTVEEKGNSSRPSSVRLKKSSVRTSGAQCVD